jgi:hypothetical protein
MKMYNHKPRNPKPGDLYYDKSVGILYCYNNNEWRLMVLDSKSEDDLKKEEMKKLIEML